MTKPRLCLPQRRRTGVLLFGSAHPSSRANRATAASQSAASSIYPAAGTVEPHFYFRRGMFACYPYVSMFELL